MGGILIAYCKARANEKQKRPKPGHPFGRLAWLLQEASCDREEYQQGMARFLLHRTK